MPLQPVPAVLLLLWFQLRRTQVLTFLLAECLINLRLTNLPFRHHLHHQLQLMIQWNILVHKLCLALLLPLRLPENYRLYILFLNGISSLLRFHLTEAWPGLATTRLLPDTAFATAPCKGCHNISHFNYCLRRTRWKTAVITLKYLF